MDITAGLKEVIVLLGVGHVFSARRVRRVVMRSSLIAQDA